MEPGRRHHAVRNHGKSISEWAGHSARQHRGSGDISRAGDWDRDTAGPKPSVSAVEFFHPACAAGELRTADQLHRRQGNLSLFRRRHGKYGPAGPKLLGDGTDGVERAGPESVLRYHHRSEV